MIQYVIVIKPSPEISSQVERFFNDYRIYRHTTLPPHLTLLPPFSIVNLSDEKFINLLISQNWTPFSVNLDKVYFFEGRNKVIFLSPDSISNRTIDTLSRKIIDNIQPFIQIKTDPKSSENFQSHLTLAKHVPGKEFNSVLYDAKKRFNLPLTFVCSGFSLYKNSGQGWYLVKNIFFTDK